MLCKLDVSISSPAPVSAHLELTPPGYYVVLNHRFTQVHYVMDRPPLSVIVCRGNAQLKNVSFKGFNDLGAAY